jgi:carbonic anhydrase
MKNVEIVYRYGSSDAVIRPRPADAGEARRRLDDGSRAFAALLDNVGGEGAAARRIVDVDPRDLGLHSEGGAPAQRPYAAVLGCADARVPVELIFSEGPNDLFVVRVAGNVLGDDALGSLKYAVDHLGDSLKLVVVLGHSGCGAVTAAVDIFLDPGEYLAIASKHVTRSLLDRLLVVVHSAARRMAAIRGPDVTQRAGYRDALIEAAVVSNAALAAHSVQQELTRDARGMRAAYGVYLLGTHDVWAPRAGSADVTGLADPPRDLDAFHAFGDAVMRSDRIASLLDRATGQAA